MKNVDEDGREKKRSLSKERERESLQTSGQVGHVGGIAGVDEASEARFIARSPRGKSRPAWWSLIPVARVPPL